MDALLDKWERIYSESWPGLSPPAPVLSENGFLLPMSGRALDLASGLGANAIYLAQRGLAVTALDLSSIAIGKLNNYAATHHLNIDARQQKIDSMTFPKSGYDVIVVSRFLDRTLSDEIIGALNPGGLLFYQTYTRERTGGQGPGNPDYLLVENELLTLFSPLRVVFYRENALIGNTQQGLRNEAQFVGRKKPMDRIMIEQLSPKQAWDLLQRNDRAVIIDVRTKIEHTFVGHPPGAIHIPWKEAPDWQLNPQFLDEVKKAAPDIDASVLLLCRSGQRSQDAAIALEQAGYRHLVNIVEGFEGPLDENKHRGTLGGWRFHGLPWEQT